MGMKFNCHVGVNACEVASSFDTYFFFLNIRGEREPTPLKTRLASSGQQTSISISFPRDMLFFSPSNPSFCPFRGEQRRVKARQKCFLCAWRGNPSPFSTKQTGKSGHYRRDEEILGKRALCSLFIKALQTWATLSLFSIPSLSVFHSAARPMPMKDVKRYKPLIDGICARWHWLLSEIGRGGHSRRHQLFV